MPAQPQADRGAKRIDAHLRGARAQTAAQHRLLVLRQRNAQARRRIGRWRPYATALRRATGIAGNFRPQRRWQRIAAEFHIEPVSRSCIAWPPIHRAPRPARRLHRQQGFTGGGERCSPARSTPDVQRTGAREPCRERLDAESSTNERARRARRRAPSMAQPRCNRGSATCSAMGLMSCSGLGDARLVLHAMP